MTALSVENLVVTYGNGVRAVDGINFEVAKGEIIALLGPSGCGKTSTLRCIAGLERPSEGAIRIAGTLVAGPNVFVPPQKRGINMVFQSYAVWPHLTVFENVAYGLRARRVPKAEIQKRVEAAAAIVRLSDLLGRYPWQLSGGQQQRVALARAIVTEPSLILFDEPLSNLDASLRLKMREEIAALQRSIGKTTIYVTHDQEEAMAIADRIILMNGGRIEQIGSPTHLYDSPMTLFAANFIGTSNVIEGVLAALAPDGFGRVELPSGGLLEARCHPRVKLGSKVSVVVRPETVRIAPKSSVSDQVNELSGTLTRSTYLCGRFEQTVNIGGVSIHAESDSTERFDVGAAVTISLLSSRAVIVCDLDEPSGARHF